MHADGQVNCGYRRTFRSNTVTVQTVPVGEKKSGGGSTDEGKVWFETGKRTRTNSSFKRGVALL